MLLEVGNIVEGRISTITKFGAFVSLPSGKSGLVHISEVANAYVSDVNDHLAIGQSVNVMVLEISDNGRINLSIKRAMPQVPAAMPAQRPAAPRPAAPRPSAPRAYIPKPSAPAKSDAPPSFEDKLKQFMQDSDSKMKSSKVYCQSTRGQRRRKD